MQAKALLAAAIALTSFPVWQTWANSSASPAIEVITVAANTARSSGGHSALRIGDQVYQYQVNSASLLLLRRDSWRFFEHYYRKLDNRSLTLIRLDLNAEDSQHIHARFDRFFAVQQKHIARRQALKIEQQWFACLSNETKSVSIPMIGYFEPSQNSDVSTNHLKECSEALLGAQFIDNELQKITSGIISHANKPSLCGTHKIKADLFPPLSEIEAERRLELLTLREALIILQQNRGVSPAQLIAPDDLPLSKNARIQLQHLAEHFEKSIPRLLTSARPDRGESLLLAIARYGALQHSLKQNRLYLLNVFPTDERALTLLDDKAARRHHQLLEALSAQGAETWQRVKHLQMAGDHTLSEYGYQKMEDSASRYVESRDTVREGRALLTCGPDLLLPTQQGEITPLDLPLIPAKFLLQPRQQSAASYQKYLANLQEAYGYSLFHHNCSTELAGAIQSTFKGKQGITLALGRPIAPGNRLSLIPSQLSRKIQHRWKVSDARTLPSHRIEQSNLLARKGSAAWIKLRESNRWTSTVYPGSIHDDAFLFFSDEVTVLRPIQGTANFAFGLLNTGAGIVTAPTESGRLRIKRGLSGMLYSLPEIIGLSIRKGRYDILPMPANTPSIE